MGPSTGEERKGSLSSQDGSRPTSKALLEEDPRVLLWSPIPTGD